MEPVATDLRARWLSVATRWGGGEAAASAAYDDLVDRYAEPQRRYHRLHHVAAVLTTIDELASSEPVADADAVALAGWLHDVIYDPTQPDNEARSADHARRTLSDLGAPSATVDEVARLIELTAGHEVADDDRNGRVLVDADLAILGAAAATYDRYAAAIRAEYAHVPDDAFRAGRRRILETFVARPRLFLTATAYDRFESAARANVARELEALGD
jgi:predicted metal-dependent HD superfamily phosphohydrolase